MEKIVRVHEKILDHLISLRKKDSALYFVPRKINNKYRLDKGYWFLGNEEYMNISFWNGEDQRRKTHNIGFIVLKNKSTYIELSAHDSKDKSIFLSKVAERLGGFKRLENKNIWRKHYPETNYLVNLDDFLINIKPLIDNYINKYKPIDIRLLDKDFFKKYGEPILLKREKQIQFGNKNKLSKICWNSENWKFPSGSHGKSVSADSYETNTGYGHEEWLLDKSKLIDGYHYAFLQPLNIKTDKHINEIYNISLFTINNLNKQYYVGEIKNVECIDVNESIRVFNIYKENGWIEKMRNNLERVGANYQEFVKTPSEIFFNIRFKFSNLIQPEELLEIAEDDINTTTNRYKLLPRKTDFKFRFVDEEDESEGNKKNTDKRKKVFNSDCEYDPYHDQMQNAIFEVLKSSKYDYKKVYIEKGRVDIKAITHQGKWHFFELKTNNPKLSIRNAIGQILEYAYYPDTDKAERLIIIADEEPSESVKKYLNHIRNKFSLPISYRRFILDTNYLSEDY